VNYEARIGRDIDMRRHAPDHARQFAPAPFVQCQEPHGLWQQHADAEDRTEAADLHMPFARDSRNHERDTGEVEPIEQHADERPAKQAPCEASDPLRLDQRR
jgi:hypothetical protein